MVSIEDVIGIAPTTDRQRLTWGQRFVMLLIPILLVWGGWLLFTGVRAPLEGRSAERWPTTTGTITESFIREGTSGRLRNMRRNYEPRVRYTYVVDGRTYEEDRITVLPVTYSTSGKAAGALSGYWVGRQVTVRYDPDNPSRAVLEPGWTWRKSALRLFGGTLISALGILFFILSFPLWGPRIGLTREARDPSLPPAGRRRPTIRRRR